MTAKKKVPARLTNKQVAEMVAPQVRSEKTLWYIPLEAYQSRYTLQLSDWNTRVFDSLDLDYRVLMPRTDVIRGHTGDIKVGQVLDAYGRSIWCLAQTEELMKAMRGGYINNKSVIFFEDMFHPGIEALAYAMCQIPHKDKPRIYVRCLAQSIDPDDFVHVTKMANWMRHYEEMVCSFVDGILVASEEMIAHFTIAGWKAKTYVTGLPFGKQEVLERVKRKLTPWHKRAPRVVFAARTDREKQPGFFLKIRDAYMHRYGNKIDDKEIEWAFLMGKALTSNEESIERMLTVEASYGRIALKENLTKNEYYKTLNNSRVLVNCGLQDWVSNTVSEADTLGCNVLYPAYRSFPEAFANDHTRLYVPWSIDDAVTKLHRLLLKPHPFQGFISDYQNATVLRSLIAMKLVDSLDDEDDEQFGATANFGVFPTNTEYRAHVSLPKYILPEMSPKDRHYWNYTR